MQGYFGLSSAGNLNMFSNLITEQSRNNHFLINTTKTKIWGFEEDYVTILEIPDHCRWGGPQILKNYDLPMTEFRIQAADWVEYSDTKIKCRLLYKGEILQISDLSKSLLSKPKWWHRFIVYSKKEIMSVCGS